MNDIKFDHIVCTSESMTIILFSAQINLEITRIILVYRFLLFANTALHASIIFD